MPSRIGILTLSSSRTLYFDSGQEVRGALVCARTGSEMRAAAAMAAHAGSLVMRIILLGGVVRCRTPALADERARSFSGKQIGNLAEAHEIGAGLLLDVLEGAA